MTAADPLADASHVALQPLALCRRRRAFAAAVRTNAANQALIDDGDQIFRDGFGIDPEQAQTRDDTENAADVQG